MKQGKFKISLSYQQGRFLLDHFESFLPTGIANTLKTVTRQTNLNQIEVNIFELVDIIKILRAEGKYFDDRLKQTLCNDLTDILETYERQYLLIDSI